MTQTPECGNAHNRAPNTVRADVMRVRSHPLISDDIAVGGFIYDVDTGLLNPVV